MTKFEIFQATNHAFYFRLRASNGEIVANSEGYTSKQGAERGIQAVKTYAPLREFEIFRATNNAYYFRLRAPNNEIICTSEGYTARQGAEHGVQVVKAYAPTAPVYDLTRTAA